MKQVMTVCVAAFLAIFTASAQADLDNSFMNFGFVWKDQYKDPLVMPQSVRATGERIFVFSPKIRQWAAYDAEGGLVGYGRANGGASYCADVGEPCYTPTGKFRVFRKGNVSCYSRTFPMDEGGGAPMPYCMFFKGGSAIHGSNQLSFNNSSHGCVRVTTPAAEWLSTNFMKVGTRVLVTTY